MRTLRQRTVSGLCYSHTRRIVDRYHCFCKTFDHERTSQSVSDPIWGRPVSQWLNPYSVSESSFRIRPPSQCQNPLLESDLPVSVGTLIWNQTSQSVSDSLLIVRPSARIRSTVRGIEKPAKKNRWDAIFWAGNRQRPVPISNGHNKIFHHQFLESTYFVNSHNFDISYRYEKSFFYLTTETLYI